jgi:fermentation-respiration switch protein FrsA (DUF1100 family)
MVFPGTPGLSVSFLDTMAERHGASPIEVHTEDGERLYGWHRPAQQRQGARRTLIYFHGNASSVLAPLELQESLSASGWDFVGIHYRGYPGSTGVASEAGVHRDARATWNYVTGELGTAPSRVAIHGRSLGGGVAVQLAAAVSPGALILESTFTSLAELVKARFPFLPSGLIAHPFRSRDFVSDVRCPVLVSHGSADTLVPVTHGRELANLFGARYVEAEGAEHNDPIWTGARLERYLLFLDDAVPAAQP